jgi:AhpD family alkylhydroperoxidase
MQALASAARQGGLPQTTAELVHLRTSQINGCSVCVQMHARDLKKAGESEGKWRTDGDYPDHRATPPQSRAIRVILPSMRWQDDEDHPPNRT